MIKTGTVISFSASTQVKKQAGGTYEAWELIYKSVDGTVETLQKPVQGLKFNQALATQLKSLSNGDEVTITLEKNAGGFWDVKSITKGISEEAPSVGRPAATVGKVTGSNYETPTERAERQRLIVRQSALAQAVATLAVGAKSLDSKAVIALAETYVDYVFGKKTLSEVEILQLESDVI